MTTATTTKGDRRVLARFADLPDAEREQILQALTDAERERLRPMLAQAGTGVSVQAPADGLASTAEALDRLDPWLIARCLAHQPPEPRDRLVAMLSRKTDVLTHLERMPPVTPKTAETLFKAALAQAGTATPAPPREALSFIARCRRFLGRRS